MSYQQSGVRYDTLDAFKRACQREAATTVGELARHGLKEPPGVRGESAYLIESADGYLAHVEEGLGTKNLVADKMLELTGKSFYANIGIDTVATIVNDLITTGALPISIAMHAGVGDSAWFEQKERADDLARGFAEGCRQAQAVWGGGETPALKGIIDANTIVLAGSALGQIKPKSLRIAGDVRDGDAIILLASSGVQTNGLTLCRAIAESRSDQSHSKKPSPHAPPRQAPDHGYLAKTSDGRTYGEALLDPSVIYVRFIAACQRANIKLHYAAHITGHGWRKLMRLDEPFVYQMTQLALSPPAKAPAVFDHISRSGPVDPREMYATFNMGAGFAVYIDPGDAQKVLRLAKETGYTAWQGGTVIKDGSRKAVEIKPLGIIFDGDTLSLR